MDKFRCANCSAVFDTANQLRGHQIKCRPKEKRTERIPFGVPRQRFNAPDNDGYRYKVFNDNWRKEPGRITRAKEAGYKVVKSIGSVGTNEDGSEIEGILMKIPQELYEKDRNAMDKELDKVDEQIYRGKFMEKPQDKRYLPGSGVQVQTKLTG